MMAAAVTDRSEAVRDDLRRFLRGATHEARLSQPELTHTALKLLRSLPAARQAGLEYLSSVLDGCTAQFVNKLEVGLLYFVCCIVMLMLILGIGILFDI